MYLYLTVYTAPAFLFYFYVFCGAGYLSIGGDFTQKDLLSSMTPDSSMASIARRPYLHQSHMKT